MTMNGILYAKPEAFHVDRDANGRPLNPRGEVIDTTDLQDSIREAGGIVEPILAYLGSDGLLHIRNGHRRVVAASILKLTQVPYVLTSAEIDAGLDATDLMLATNVHKAFPPIVLAKDGTVIGGLALAVVQKLDDKKPGGKRTLESLARLMGIRPDLVSAYECLYSAPINVRKAVAAGRLSMSAFARMKHAPTEVQENIVGAEDDEGNVTLDNVRDGLRQAKREQQPEMPDAVPDEAAVVGTLNEIKAKLRLILCQPLSMREMYLLKEINQLTSEVGNE